MNGELKAVDCPFCGSVSASTQEDQAQGSKWGVVVCGCGACGPEVRTQYDLSPNAPWRQRAIEAWNTRPTPAPGALPELDLLIRDMEMYAGDELEGSRLERLSAHWSKRLRAYAEQSRAGVVVTDAMAERVCASFYSDWKFTPPDHKPHLIAIMRTALQSAFADDEGVR